MKPFKLNRRTLLAALIPAAAAGCTSPLFRSQSPDAEQIVEEEKERWELVGDLTVPGGMNYEWVQGVGLVTSLRDTGSDPPPSPERDALIDEMLTHDTDKPQSLLALKSTSLVIVRGFLPPGVQKGDRIDIEVTLPSDSETTSLRGGWLMKARLRQLAMLNDVVRKGNIDALGQGPVLVDAVFDETNDSSSELRGRILGGGVAMKTRKLGLLLRDERASVRTSTIIAAAINNRFNHYEGSSRVGVAQPINSHHIELAVAPVYRHNVGRYIRVIQHISLGESPADHVLRLQTLEKKLLEPASAASAALELEGIGKEAIEILRKGLQSSDPEVRFYSAEALAYFDETDAAPVLADAAANERAFRWHALTALSSMHHVAAVDGLSELLHHTSAEARYGAFRAMQYRNPHDTLVQGEWLSDKFSLHQIATTGEPMIHFSRSRRPEIVVFGLHQKVSPPVVILAGRHTMIKADGNSRLKIIRYQPGQDDKVLTCPNELDAMIRTIVELGGNYEEVYEAVRSAKIGGHLKARLAVNARANGGRVYRRNDAELEDAAEPTRFSVHNPLPELFQDRLDESESEAEDKERWSNNSDSEKPSVFGRMKGWFGWDEEAE